MRTIILCLAAAAIAAAHPLDPLTKEELDVVYTEITALADNKKGLMDEEIAELARRSQQAMAETTGD